MKISLKNSSETAHIIEDDYVLNEHNMKEFIN